MAESLGKVVAIIIAVCLLVIYPLGDMFQHKDDLSYLIAFNATTNFVDTVREKGYISPRMYYTFLDQIAITGNTYDIELTHMHKKIVPEYTDPAQFSTFQNNIYKVYDGFYTDQILEELFDETNRSANIDYNVDFGDYFLVEIKNTNRTEADIFNAMFIGSSGKYPKIFVRYGGLVRNEN